MLHREVIALIAQELDDSPAPQYIDVSRREVFANKKSPSRTEFSAAGAVGINAQVVFEVREGEYGGEQVIEHEGTRYNVYRVYEKGFAIEIYCGSVKG